MEHEWGCKLQSVPWFQLVKELLKILVNACSNSLVGSIGYKKTKKHNIRFQDALIIMPIESDYSLRFILYLSLTSLLNNHFQSTDDKSVADLQIFHSNHVIISVTAIGRLVRWYLPLELMQTVTNLYLFRALKEVFTPLFQLSPAICAGFWRQQRESHASSC